MRLRFAVGSLGLAVLTATTLVPPALSATSAATRSKSCWAQADKKGLHGEARTAFHKTCVEGALAPAAPTRADAGSTAAKAITAPSGADRTERSKACAAEADAKGKTDNQRKSIRLTCMASAAPPAATGTPQHPPTPTPNKDQLGTMPR